jgi:hypothetical protein
VNDNRPVTGRKPSLEDLRRARGEGWQWPRIVNEACPQCGLDPASLPCESLGPRLMELATAWREFIDVADGAYLRTNPEPGVFSPIQYGAHVRDILRVYGDRIERAVGEDNPTFAQFNPSDDIWEQYNTIGATELSDDLEAHARRLASILANLGADDWSRTLTRDGGEDGVYTFTVAGQARYAVHEVHHHLLDADGTLPARDQGE